MFAKSINFNVSSCTQAAGPPPQQATPQLKTQFEINDLADTDRILLTSKSIQNDIEEFSGKFDLLVLVNKHALMIRDTYLVFT